jgi:hypothetical protein
MWREPGPETGMGLAPQEAAAHVEQYMKYEKQRCQRTGLCHESAVNVCRFAGALGCQKR